MNNAPLMSRLYHQPRSPMPGQQMQQPVQQARPQFAAAHPLGAMMGSMLNIPQQRKPQALPGGGLAMDRIIAQLMNKR